MMMHGLANPEFNVK